MLCPLLLLMKLMMLMYDWRSLLLRLKLADPDCYTASYGPMGERVDLPFVFYANNCLQVKK